MRGRRPKSSRQKALEGNPGRRPVNDDEPTPEDLTSDAVPVELAADARAVAEWQRLVPLLQRARQITEADRTALIAVCREWSLYVEATGKREPLVTRTPNGYPMMNPYLAIARSALAACVRLWEQLGLTPSARSRVSRMVPPELDAADPFAEFDEPIEPPVH